MQSVDPPRTSPASALIFATGVHIARFLVIILAIEIAPLLGFTGWFTGLFVNILCVAFAIALVTVLKMWRSSGIGKLWRSWRAMLWLIPFIVEAAVWALVPSGIEILPPGFGLWALTLLLVGVNEELTSRVVVLGTLRKAYSRTPAVVLTAALFGLQHLSVLATTPSRVDGVLFNVLLSAISGFAMAAFQVRFAWIWPLILTHAATDFTIVMSGGSAPDSWEVVVHVLLVLLGVLLLRGAPAATREPTGGALFPRREGDALEVLRQHDA